jgi:uncharacterized protein (DUF2235 family)
MKNIVICADGTWNRPEGLNSDDQPTNVLRLARAIERVSKENAKQVVFYDWGIGSYHNSALAGGVGMGLEKNVMDGYRFLVHNYEPGDRIYLFGFSRGAYTVRSLSALINNAGILKSVEGRRVEEAFELYKNPDCPPRSEYAITYRNSYAVEQKSNVHFIGVWDTVGAMGLPFTLFGLIKDKDLFYDHKIGGNVKTIRHALALDEFRKDFAPTIWEDRDNVDIQQVWFAGCHSDVGGSYSPDNEGRLLSDIPLKWMANEASKFGLNIDDDIHQLAEHPLAELNNEYKGKFKLLGKLTRKIPKNNKSAQYLHKSVLTRLEQSQYKTKTLKDFRTSNPADLIVIE